MVRSQIVLFGDSITQFSFDVGGWGARIASRYQRRADVLARGYRYAVSFQKSLLRCDYSHGFILDSGYNTRWALQVVPNIRDIDGCVTRLVTVFFGANDSSLNAVNPRQHVPISEYASNLHAIVAGLRSTCPSAAVVIITPPPICEILLSEQPRLKKSRTNDSAGEYATAAATVAAELGVPCLNLWAEMQAIRPDWGAAFLSDGLHLTEAGNACVATLLLSLIDDQLPSLKVIPDKNTGSFGNSGSVSSLPHDAPWHDSITDPLDFASVFAKTPGH